MHANPFHLYTVYTQNLKLLYPKKKQQKSRKKLSKSEQDGVGGICGISFRLKAVGYRPLHCAFQYDNFYTNFEKRYNNFFVGCHMTFGKVVYLLIQFIAFPVICSLH